LEEQNESSFSHDTRHGAQPDPHLRDGLYTVNSHALTELDTHTTWTRVIFIVPLSNIDGTNIEKKINV
jgi:hypothetical protein